MLQVLAYFNLINSPDPERTHGGCAKSMQTRLNGTNGVLDATRWMMHVKVAVHESLVDWRGGQPPLWQLLCHLYGILCTQLEAHLNERWSMLIFLISEGILRLLLCVKILMLIYLEWLSINYGHFTQEWSKFCKVAIKIIVSLPDWLLDSAVP